MILPFLALLCIGWQSLPAQEHAPTESKHLLDAIALDQSVIDAVRGGSGCLLPAGFLPWADRPLKTDVDVKSINVFLDLRPFLSVRDANIDVPLTTVGRVDIECFRQTADQKTIVLHAHSSFIPDITLLEVNSRAAEFVRVGTDSLVISIDPVFPERQLAVSIEYTVRRTLLETGLSVVAGEGLAQYAAPHPIAFTFSQPEGARRWFPCNDVPSDRATYSFTATVPKGFTVVSNGQLQETVEVDTASESQKWVCNAEIPSYLFAMAASVYHSYPQTATLLSGRELPIANFHWDIDHDGDSLSAVRALANVPEMFPAMERLFGPYPYDTYGHMTVWPITFGGMEHATMSTISRDWLRGTVEVGYAHEVGHQWLGDMVTCAHWGDIWLNEGGASFSEAVWLGAKYGKQAYLNHLLSRRARYIRQGFRGPSVANIPLSNMFNEATTYSKSAWIYHMVASIMGDTAFSTFVNSWSHVGGPNVGQSVQTSDFIEGVKRFAPNAAINWDTFFRQWLYERGHPVFSASAIVNNLPNGGARVQVDLRQVQESQGVPDAFEVLVPLRCTSNGTVFDTTIAVTQRNVIVDMVLPFAPTRVQIDTASVLLCEVLGDVVLSVSDVQSTTQGITLLSQHPASPSVPLIVQVSGTPEGWVEVADVTGRVVARAAVENSYPVVSLDVSTAASGIVCIRHIANARTIQILPCLIVR